MGVTPTAGRRSTPEEHSYNGFRRTHSRALLFVASVLLACSGGWSIAEAGGAAGAPAQLTENAPVPTHKQTTAAQMRDLGKRHYRQGDYDSSRKAFMGKTMRVRSFFPPVRARDRLLF